MTSNSSVIRGTMAPPEEQLLLKEMHMKNSISITPSKPNNRYGDKKYVEPVRLTPAWEEKNLPNDVLNFKSVTMEQAELETNPPKDRLLVVYLIILTFGIGTMMPWNMFINAKLYFEDYKLGSNYTNNQNLTFYKDNFMVFLGISSQVPNFLFNWVNVFVNLGGSLTSRIVYTIIAEVIIFIATEVLVMLDSSAWPEIFFWLTMASVFLLNMANGIYQNTVYGIAARLPAAYTGAVIFGNNLSGVFTSVMNIVTKMLSPSPKTSALYYFMVALLVLFICFDIYFVLPLLKFYKFHDLQFIKAQSNAKEYSVVKKTPYWKIFKMCSLQCFNVFFIFFVTLAIFPAVHSNVQLVHDDFIVPAKYFSDIMCFLTFNVFAAFGNVLATVWHFPGRRWLHVPVILRAAFIPLFLVCNYTLPNRVMPILIENEWIYWGIAAAFALTSGWFSSLGMMYCGKSVPPEYSSVAGMFGAACLVSGVCSGILFAFVFPIVVRSVKW
ncbi:equilibrative nucleoside transporter 1-like [Planococcus citri]|uniref:equilibrative nucleoside transporter 1-like n=1 Tax=Planococcus citri TaxID=170843 RepID=UPI0031F85386